MDEQSPGLPERFPVAVGSQALARSTYSKMLPETEDHTSFFSFFDVTEKIATVCGTFAFGAIEALTGSMRNSILSVALFFLAVTSGQDVVVLNRGNIEQVGSPLDLYNRPANEFVARFIGSPSMNFFPAKIRKEGSNVLVDTGDFAVKLPDDRAGKYAPMAGKDVIFGIRPEDIHNPAFAPPGISASPVEAKVDVTELMGNEIFLYLVSGKDSYVARVDPRTRFQMGDQVQLVFNMENFHIFDPELDKENPVAVR